MQITVPSPSEENINTNIDKDSKNDKRPSTCSFDKKRKNLNLKGSGMFGNKVDLLPNRSVDI